MAAVSGPDIGRCFFISLRSGMAYVLMFQSGLVIVLLLYIYNMAFHPILDFFYIVRGVLLNSPLVVFSVTAIASVVMGTLAIGRGVGRKVRDRRERAQIARIWMWLSILLIPLQLFWGCYYSYRTLMVVRDFTPSLVIGNAIMSGIVQKMLPMAGGANAAKNRRKESMAKISTIFSRPYNEKEAEDPLESRKYTFWGTNLKRWFYRNGTGVLAGGALLACFVIGAFTDEMQMVYEVLPYPVNELYNQGRNFVFTFLLATFVPTIILSLCALHVAAFATVLGRGGVGDEMVGWRRLRWFYTLEGTERRAVRAGKIKNDMKRPVGRGEYPGADDDTSGSEFIKALEYDGQDRGFN